MIEWIPISKKKPDTWQRILVTYTVTFTSSNDSDDVSENWVEHNVVFAWLRDDGKEHDVCFGSSTKPVTYYFELDDACETNIPLYKLKEPYEGNSHCRYEYEVTAWAELPLPYIKKAKQKKVYQDIVNEDVRKYMIENNMPPFDTSNLLDQLAEDDKKKNHLGRTEDFL